jgi:diketogulonate reductase-like aldo/keto reductase
MQVHNLLDWRVHLKTMRRMKEAGRIRHLGVTHYTSSAYAELEAVLRAEPLDFVQLNYSVMDRAAEQRLLPLALERRVAVLAICRSRADRRCAPSRRVRFPRWPASSPARAGRSCCSSSSSATRR